MGKAGRVPLLIAYALNIIDYALTAYWVELYGTDIEANPLMRWAFENNVAWAVKIFGVGSLMALVGYLVKRYNKCLWSGCVLLVAYAALTAYHIILTAITFL